MGTNRLIANLQPKSKLLRVAEYYDMALALSTPGGPTESANPFKRTASRSLGVRPRRERFISRILNIWMTVLGLPLRIAVGRETIGRRRQWRERNILPARRGEIRKRARPNNRRNCGLSR